MTQSTRTCTFSECDRKHYARGLCGGHYQQQVAGKDLKPLRVIDPNRVCEAEGCEDKPSTKGYCGMHYRRFKRTGSPERGKYGKLKICSVESCQRASRSRGMCDMHFKRELRGELRYEVTCAQCGRTKRTKLPNQVYCSYSCASKGTYQRTKGSRKLRSTPLADACRSGDAAAILAAIKAKTTLNDNGCWVWAGRLNDQGYASASIMGGYKAIHRLSLEAQLGCSLGKIQAHHKCAVRACVNPDHLQPAHQVDNIVEMKIRSSLTARIEQLESELRRLDPENPLLALASRSL